MVRAGNKTVALVLVSLLMVGAHRHREARHTPGVHLHAGASEGPCALCLLSLGLPQAPPQISLFHGEVAGPVRPAAAPHCLRPTRATSRAPPA
ncbi:MAG: hypothetical protein KC910_37025 [Candidatus Eremiobacteraeota bacterium]|nr:hypothetical protein [Candidatus Eremiobacteraeota bacterium]